MGKPISPDASTRSWALWLGATVATFAALEAHAVSTRRQPTLTHALRLWLGIEPGRRRRHLAGGGFAAFFLWLIAHTVFGLGPNLKERGGTP